MRILYFDCIAGISGDMALGALIQAGADADMIRERLSSLPIEPFDLEVAEVDTHGIHAMKVTVHAGASAVVRTYANIRALLEAADLPAEAKALAQRIFRRLAVAEAAVHDREVEQVIFHEVGAVDSIVDITGSALALTMLGVERIYASAVPTGLGMVKSEHGMMPIPAPAVVELLRGIPIYSRGVPMELVTPTGAAILAATVEGFGELPRIRTDGVGYGVGSARLDFPNVLRVLVGEDDPAAGSDQDRSPTPEETLLATNVDDLNPELYPYVLERLFEAGAQDAWLSPIIMKKGRPAVTISVLCNPARADAMRQVLFRETGTLGVRGTAVDKVALERDSMQVRTEFGLVRVKLGILEGAVVTTSPEFEDCVKLAREAGVPAREIFEQAERRARETLREQEGSP
ncbi:MAG: nickel pincer cofactor biosynthesis protein LarC [Actinomycetota bacterium]